MLCTAHKVQIYMSQIPLCFHSSALLLNYGAVQQLWKDVNPVVFCKPVTSKASQRKWNKFRCLMVDQRNQQLSEDVIWRWKSCLSSMRMWLHPSTGERVFTVRLRAEVWKIRQDSCIADRCVCVCVCEALSWRHFILPQGPKHHINADASMSVMDQMETRSSSLTEQLKLFL